MRHDANGPTARGTDTLAPGMLASAASEKGPGTLSPAASEPSVGPTSVTSGAASCGSASAAASCAPLDGENTPESTSHDASTKRPNTHVSESRIFAAFII